MKIVWPTKKLGEICEINPTKAEIKDIAENVLISFVPMSSVSESSQTIVEQQERKLREVRKGYTYFKKGDILFAKITPCMENGKVALSKNLNNDIGFASTEFHVIRPGSEIIPEYVFNVLASNKFREEAEERMTGSAGQKRVPKVFLENYKIPLPPPFVQKKIVKVLEEKLGKVKEAIKLREDALADTEKILPTRLTEFFDESREKYKKITFGNLAILVRGPFGGSLTKSMFVDSGYAVYEQGNVIKNQTKDFRYFISEKKYKDMERFSVQPGDILMSCSGTIGKFTVIQDNHIAGIINQALLKITPKLNKVTQRYLQNSLVDHLARSTTHIKGGAIKNIMSVKELKKIEVPTPDLKTQEKIVKELDELSVRVAELRALQKEQLADLKSLERAYLHEAFSGRLT